MAGIYTAYPLCNLLAVSGGVADVPSRSAPVAR